jgi:hypothetical protein
LALRKSGCLFCGNENGAFAKEEHIIPFTLGNSIRSGLVTEELVVPPGEVCDKCNGRRLSPRDRALANWGPVSAFRSLALVPNRKRRLVDAVDETQWEVSLDPNDPRLFTLTTVVATGSDTCREDVARALCKIALETRWLDDPADARATRWDPVADAALGGPLPNDLAFGLMLPEAADMDPRPSSQLMLLKDDYRLRFLCEIRVVGLTFLLLVGSEIRPTLERTAWWETEPASGSLVGPDSMWASFVGGAESAERRTDATPEPDPRHRSRLPTGVAGHRIYVIPGDAAQQPGRNGPVS